MATTYADIVTSALRILGVVADEEAPTASQMQTGLASLSDLLDSWSNERWMQALQVRRDVPLVAGQQVYNFGTDIVAFPAPNWISVAAIFWDNGVQSPVALITEDEWMNNIQTKNVSGLPSALFFERFVSQTANPPITARINLWPIPNASNYTLAYYGFEKLATLSNPNADLDGLYPNGFYRAMKYNLAIDMSEDFGVVPTARVDQIAMESVASVKRFASRTPVMNCDSSVLQRNVFGTGYAYWGVV